jgi:hypothetical protein
VHIGFRAFSAPSRGRGSGEWRSTIPLRSAREALSAAGLDAKTASAIVWTYRADAAIEELSAAGLTEITCLAHQSQIPD